MKPAKVIRLPQKSKYTEEELAKNEVLVNFLEIDAMRLELKRIVKRIRESARKKKTDIYGRGTYERSTFYIGRTVTRVSFLWLYVSPYQMKKVCDQLKAAMNEKRYKYYYYTHNCSLHVYMEGERKE